MVDVKVDFRRLRQRLQRMERKLATTAATTVKELVDYGKLKAKLLVPYETGATYRSIKGQVTQTPKGAQGKIFIEPGHPTTSYSNEGAQTTEELVIIMHKWAGAQRHFHTGDPRFMYKVRNDLKERAKSVSRKNILNGINFK
jgi:hypothetical protein